jgi:hypothetical protein
MLPTISSNEEMIFTWIFLGSYQKCQTGCWALFLGHIYGVLRPVFYAVIPRVHYDTDNPYVAPSLPELPANRVSTAKVMPSEFLVHNGDHRTILVVVFIEISAAEERLPQCLEIVGLMKLKLTTSSPRTGLGV